MRYGREVMEKLEAATKLLREAENMAKVDDRRVCRQIVGAVERTLAARAAVRSRVES